MHFLYCSMSSLHIWLDLQHIKIERIAPLHARDFGMVWRDFYFYFFYLKLRGLDFISLTPLLTPHPPQWTKQRQHNSLCQVLQCRGTESVKGSIEICSPAVRPSHSPLGPERTKERERERNARGEMDPTNVPPSCLSITNLFSQLHLHQSSLCRNANKFVKI